MTSKQHKKPCATCPFADKSKPGSDARMSTSVLVGQLFLPYRIPCHQMIDYSDLDWQTSPDSNVLPQCVGHAMCRDGQGVADKMPEQLLCIAHDPTTGAFANIYEFYAHHEEITVEEAKKILTPHYIQFLCHLELQRPGIRGIPKEPQGV